MVKKEIFDAFYLHIKWLGYVRDLCTPTARTGASDGKHDFFRERCPICV